MIHHGPAVGETGELESVVVIHEFEPRGSELFRGGHEVPREALHPLRAVVTVGHIAQPRVTAPVEELPFDQGIDILQESGLAVVGQHDLKAVVIAQGFDARRGDGPQGRELHIPVPQAGDLLQGDAQVFLRFAECAHRVQLSADLHGCYLLRMGIWF